MKRKTAKQFWNKHMNDLDGTGFTQGLKNYLEAETQRVLQCCKEKYPKLVLEVGCGKGRLIEHIKKYCSKIIGIDYSKAMVGFCRKKFEGNPKITIKKQDILKLPFQNNSFDLIILGFNTLGNIKDQNKAIRELSKILSPRGELIVSVYSEDALPEQLQTYKNLGLTGIRESGRTIYTNEGLFSHRFSKEELENLLNSADLTANIQPLTKISYFAIARKRGENESA